MIGRDVSCFILGMSLMRVNKRRSPATFDRTFHKNLPFAQGQAVALAGGVCWRLKIWAPEARYGCQERAIAARASRIACKPLEMPRFHGQLWPRKLVSGPSKSNFSQIGEVIGRACGVCEMGARGITPPHPWREP